MTPGSFPTNRCLSLWAQRFPDRNHLWAGVLRLWRVDLPVAAASGRGLLREWVAKAAALGSGSPREIARRLCIPEASVRAAQAGDLGPRSRAWVELPSGLRPVVPPPAPVLEWPDRITPTDVPPDVLRPLGVDLPATSDDPLSFPVIRAEAVAIAAVSIGGRIEVFTADRDWQIGAMSVWTLPGDALPAACPEDWSRAWRRWCSTHSAGLAAEEWKIAVSTGVAHLCPPSGGRPELPALGDPWLWAGDGPLREAALVELSRG